MGKELNIYLVRHGESYFNRRGRMQGWADSPLTPEGAKTVADAGKGLRTIPFASAYSSDSGRAVQTRDIIIRANDRKDIRCTALEGLREFNFGLYEGEFFMTAWAKIAKSKGYADAADLTTGVRLAPRMNYVYDAVDNPEAEQVDQFTDRILTTMQHIVDTAYRHNEEHVLVVSHGVTIVTLLEHYGMPGDMMRSPLNASVSKVVFHDGKETLAYVNNVEFIEAGKNLPE